MATATETARLFSEMKYWLTDLAVSLQNESEENAEKFDEQLDKSLVALAKIDAKQAASIKTQVETVKTIAIEAVDAFSDNNRVLGNSKLAKTRESIIGVDKALVTITTQLQRQSATAKLTDVSSARAAVAPAKAAVVTAEAALKSAQAAVTVANRGVEAANKAIEDAQFAGEVSIWTPVGSVLIAVILTWLVVRSITKPMAELTSAMGRLADGDLEIEVPAQNKSDEIGQMAAAVQVFKENSLEMQRLESEQEEAKRRSEEEQNG